MSVLTAKPAKAASRVGYVVKRYPRFSETFIVNEILAHEASGMELDIFALRPTVDTHFQNGISQVRASVTYLPTGSVKSSEFWKTCHKLARKFPCLWETLAGARHATVMEAYQAVQLAKQARERGISHLHAHFATSAATVARLAAAIAGITYSVTMHAKDIFHETVDPEDLKSKILDAEFVVTVSDFNVQYLSAKFGNQEKIHCIYNGLDLKLFDFNPSFEHDRKIITVGRLVPKKGLRYLIDACRILADRGVDFSCEIIGTGELEASLRDQIESLSLGDCVQLSGPQPQNVVREKICAAAVFAAPCVIADDGNRDGLPTVITESLALGTPCVATDVTGIPEIVRHEETGIIVQQHNADDLATQLQRLLDDPATCRSLASNARQLIEKDFDIKRNVARIRALFPKRALSVQTPSSSQSQGV
jgi:glycosyltransferase involved in cell wall biosynthesis